MDSIDAEVANVIKSDSESFVGEYNSICEEDNRLTLHITFKYKNNNRIYSLEWENKAKKTVHWGEGMLVDDILIGNLTKVKLNYSLRMSS